MEHFYKDTIGENWFTYQELYTFIPKYFGQGAVFVEVGSWKGKSVCFLAVEVINQKKNQKIYTVDTWGFQDYIKLSEDYALLNKEEKNIDESDILYETYLKNIEPVKNYITSLRGSSIEVAKQFEDKSIDFVFIDADHEYESVINDIITWLPKIKDGGIIAGHDYSKNPEAAVNRAVDEIFGKNKVTFPADRTWMYKIC